MVENQVMAVQNQRTIVWNRKTQKAVRKTKGSPAPAKAVRMRAKLGTTGANGGKYLALLQDDLLNNSNVLFYDCFVNQPLPFVFFVGRKREEKEKAQKGQKEQGIPFIFSITE